MCHDDRRRPVAQLRGSPCGKQSTECRPALCPIFAWLIPHTFVVFHGKPLANPYRNNLFFKESFRVCFQSSPMAFMAEIIKSFTRKTIANYTRLCTCPHVVIRVRVHKTILHESIVQRQRNEMINALHEFFKKCL